MFKVNQRNMFKVNNNVNDVTLVSLLLTLNISTPFSVFIVDFEQENVSP